MSPDALADLRRLCEAIYGRRWQSAFARVLGVNPRTVRRWAAGDAPVPPWALQHVKALAGGWCPTCGAFTHGGLAPAEVRELDRQTWERGDATPPDRIKL